MEGALSTPFNDSISFFREYWLDMNVHVQIISSRTHLLSASHLVLLVGGDRRDKKSNNETKTRFEQKFI